MLTATSKRPETIPEKFIRELKAANPSPKSILVYACHFGYLATIANSRFRGARVTGYDIDPRRIEKIESIRPRLASMREVDFVSSLPQQQFDLVLAHAIIHDDLEKFGTEVLSLVNPQGFVGVMEYDMKGMERADFFSRWGTVIGEQEETRKIGADLTHKRHTQLGLEDYQRFMQQHGVTEVFSEGDLPSSSALNGYKPTIHCIYIGRKTR